MPTPCQCPLAGYCETHKRHMSVLRHRQCRDEAGYYEAFARGGVQGAATADAPTCVHRGPLVHREPCSCGSATTVPIYRCELHQTRRGRGRLCVPTLPEWRSVRDHDVRHALLCCETCSDNNSHQGPS